MSSEYELWGQIGATFHLTDEEMERLLLFDHDSADLFSEVIKDRRYEINDQFYAPESETGKDIYISLYKSDRKDAVWPKRNDGELYPRKIWCRMGVSFSVDDRQMQILEKDDPASAELIFDLTDSGQYETWGSCLFETGNEIEGYDEPEQQSYIDIYRDESPPKTWITEADIKFN